jgi:hypothetical protein
VLFEYPEDYVPEILQQMEAVGGLHGRHEAPPFWRPVHTHRHDPGLLSPPPGAP